MWTEVGADEESPETLIYLSDEPRRGKCPERPADETEDMTATEDRHDRDRRHPLSAPRILTVLTAGGSPG